MKEKGKKTMKINTFQGSSFPRYLLRKNKNVPTERLVLDT